MSKRMGKRSTAKPSGLNRRGTPREGITDADAPPVFNSVPTLAWQEEVAPVEATTNEDDEADANPTSGVGWPE